MPKVFSSNTRNTRKQTGAWIGKLDRGLTADETEELETWKIADPRNARVFEKQQRNWKRLDSVVDWKPEHALEMNPDLLARGSARSKKH